jgi:hypothetical protein
MSGTTEPASGSRPGIAVDHALSIPLASLEVDAELSRGIAKVVQGRLVIEPESGGSAEAAISGTIDFLLWIAELTIMSEAVNRGETEPSNYRLVGPPDRPVGLISPGKR